MYVLILAAIIGTLFLAGCIGVIEQGSHPLGPCDGVTISGYGWNDQTSQWVKC